MPNYVRKGAKLRCSMGNCQSPLMISPDRRVLIGDTEMANITDIKPIMNIQPFGLCRSLANPSVASATSAAMGVLTPMPCIPCTSTPWMGGEPGVLLRGQPALLDNSNLMCQWAGIIDITEDGQQNMQKNKNTSEHNSLADTQGQKEEEGKIESVSWVDEEEKAVTSIEYKESAYILITPKGIATGQAKVKIVDTTTNDKVKEWDKAEDSDIEFTIDINDNKGKKEFTPDDAWFSKRALVKKISVEIYYKDEKIKIPIKPLSIKKINYNKDMTVHENGMRFTAQEESLAMICPDGKIRAYKDTKNNWTIGYGEMSGITSTTELDSKDVAWDRFENKIKGDYQKQARRVLFECGIKRKLEQYEFDTIVDLVYNAWSCSSIVGKIADGEEVTEQMFLNFKGSGLAIRRKAEYKLYKNQITSVKGPKEYHRKDNTNGGYEDMEKKDDKGEVIKDDKGKPIKEKGWYSKASTETYTITY